MTYPNLYHLKYFVDAVELGSISAAARKNLVSHSAISQAVKSVESHLGMDLMNHRKKNFEVTTKGFNIASKAKSLLSTWDEMASEQISSTGEITGKLVLGVSRSLAQAFLGSILSHLKASHPGIQLEIKFGTTGALVERTAQDELDLSITIDQQSLPTLQQKLLRKGNFVLIAPTQKKRDWKYILTEPKYETELLKKTFFERHKKPLPVYLEVGSWDTIVQLVSEGHGIGLVPDVAASSEKRGLIKRLSVPWYQCHCEIYLNEKKTIRAKEMKMAVGSTIQKIIK